MLAEAGRRAAETLPCDADADDVDAVVNNLMSVASKLITGSAFAPRPGQPGWTQVAQLAEYGVRALKDELDVRRLQAAHETHRTDSSARRVPAPDPQPYGASPAGAEQLAAQWLRHLGATSVAVTRASEDGGVDVTSAEHVAQAKAWSGPVGVVEVRALAGVAAHDGRQAVLYATTCYTAEAVAFGAQARVALLTMSAEAATLTPVTESARRLVSGPGRGVTPGR